VGRDDRLVPQILMKVYDSSRCHADPDAWLNRCVESAMVAHLEDAAETPWGAYLMEDLKAYLSLQIGALEQCADQAEMALDMAKPAALLRQTVHQLRRLQEAKTWDQVMERKELDYGRLTFSKKCDPELSQRIKEVRSACKKGVEKKLKSFSGSSAQMLMDMTHCAPSVRAIVSLVKEFDRVYARLKNKRRVLDFGDLEQRMLDLLLGKKRNAVTFVAREIGKRFREIMVDEYQDSNRVQDSIFSALAGDSGKLFMVGDVKQSIYQFRLADPGIFLEKYDRYPHAEELGKAEGKKVLLSSNFRSSGGVLKAVNDVFAGCMTRAVGGLDYGPEEALVEGIPHVSLNEPEVELLAVDVQESTYEEEAQVVAHRIRELLDGKHFVREGESLRPIRPEDITILLRSPGSVGSYYVAALESMGIRCASGGGEDVLKTEEIGVLRSILQIIENPRQDIPLLSVLASPIFCFTADDLAVLRGQCRKGSIYDALLQSKTKKAEAFLSTLNALRKAVSLQPLVQLLEQVFFLTRLDSLYGAMPDGAVRRKNLESFYMLAGEFQSSGNRTLGQFLDFLDSVEEKGLVSLREQNAAGAVTLMSIHKSKGLEFPVVFVCGLSREFNRESVRSQILCHQDLGLGLTALDEENRVRYPTLAKRAIAVKMTQDSLSEEMRVLYVALTRARDRLIMTYAGGKLAEDLQQIVSRMDAGSRELLSQDAVCPGQWVLMAAVGRSEAGALFALGGRPEQVSVGDNPWRIRVVQGEEADQGTEEAFPEDSLPKELLHRMKKGLAFSYPYASATAAPSKQTATQRKGREKDAEAAEDAPESSRHAMQWRHPGMEKEERKAVQRGNAMHLCMQYLDFTACKDEASVKANVDMLVAAGRLSLEEAEAVSCKQIAAFFRSPLGLRLQSAPQVLREFKFSVLNDGQTVDPALSGEKILLQGVVDCALVEDDGITIIDFKSDRVTPETVAQRASAYVHQVQTYARAMARIYERPVKEAVLYFFAIDQIVPVKLDGDL